MTKLIYVGNLALVMMSSVPLRIMTFLPIKLIYILYHGCVAKE